jgi:hypothetical protein
MRRQRQRHYLPLSAEEGGDARPKQRQLHQNRFALPDGSPLQHSAAVEGGDAAYPPAEEEEDDARRAGRGEGEASPWARRWGEGGGEVGCSWSGLPTSWGRDVLSIYGG